MASLNSVFEAGLKATKIALDASAKAKREVDIAAERSASRAESEGMRAEETLSRCFLLGMAFTEQVCRFGEGRHKPRHGCFA